MIFEEQLSRKPNLYPWTQTFINAMWAGHWTPNEFNFQSDVQDYKITFSEDEKQVVKNTLSAIAQIEVAVKKFWARLGDNLPHPSLNDLGAVMSHVEVIHNLAYEKLLTVLNLDDIFEENLKKDIIKGRVEYLRKYNHKYYKDSKKQYVYSLVLFTLFVENVSLFSQFYIISWFKKYYNTLNDTAKQIAYTAKEETIHALVGIKIINTIREEYPELFDEELETRVLTEAAEAFRCESDIIDWILGGYEQPRLSEDRPPLNADILKNFIKNMFNVYLKQIGFKEIFDDIDEELINETEWFDDEISGDTLTDFFAGRPIGYTKGRSYDDEELF